MAENVLSLIYNTRLNGLDSKLEIMLSSSGSFLISYNRQLPCTKVTDQDLLVSAP